MPSSPTHQELPPPPAGKTGWPWTTASPALGTSTPSGKAWPRITIVTPNYNYGAFLEETIRSVLLQGYPNLELIVADGGSKDDSVSVIRKYERWITSWVSEPDRGQANAINKGFARATGDVCNWLNSDDLLMPGALGFVGELYATGRFDWIAGARILKDADGVVLDLQTPWLTQWHWIALGTPDFPQEATFFARSVWESVGGLDESLDCTFDVAFFSRMLKVSQRGVFARFPIGAMNSHGAQKTLTQDSAAFKDESVRVLAEMLPGALDRAVYRMSRTRFWPLVDAGLRLSMRPRARRYEVASLDPVTRQIKLSPGTGL